MGALFSSPSPEPIVLNVEDLTSKSSLDDVVSEAYHTEPSRPERLPVTAFYPQLQTRSYSQYFKCLLCNDFAGENTPLAPSHPLEGSLKSYKISAARGCASCDVLVKAAEHFLREIGPPQELDEAIFVEFQPGLENRPHYWAMRVTYREERPWGVCRKIAESGRGKGNGQFELDVFITKDDPHPWNLNSSFPNLRSRIPYRRHVKGHTGESESLDTAKSWLKQCDESHTCRSTQLTTLPTRILDISISPIRMIEGAEVLRCPNLDSPYPLGTYAALSHCWGQSVQVQLLKSNFLEYSTGAGVPWESLSEVFRDAITSARALDLRYIWIDSLCIVQDDLDDWNREASKMAQVYSGAYVTLAAAASKDGRLSMYTPATPVFTVEAFTCDEQPYRVHFRQEISHHDRPSRAEFPLLHRGWVYQERILSSRIIYFGPGEIFWECFESTHCECGTLNAEENEKMSFRVCNQQSRNPERHWRRLVMKYTSLNLTNTSDRLIALSGIAEKVQEIRQDEYLGGLWRETLVYDLLWSCWRADNNIKLKIAPSWSWASRSVAVSYDSYFSSSSGSSPTWYDGYRATVLGIKTTTTDKHTFEGSLTLSTKIRALNPKGKLLKHLKSTWFLGKEIKFNFEEAIKFDCDEARAWWEDGELFQIYIARIPISDCQSDEYDYYDFSLIVKKAVGKEAVYDRVGMMRIYQFVKTGQDDSEEEHRLKEEFLGYKGLPETPITLI